MGRANELRRLVALAQQWHGPVAEQIQNAVGRRTDPTVQLERKRARLARKRQWASRWTVVWSLIAVIFAMVAAFAFTGIMDSGAEGAVTGIVISLIAGTLAVRSGMRMHRIGREYQALGGGASTPIARPPALPPRGSLARQPVERLAEAEGALNELLHQLGRSASVPAESVDRARRTGAEAAGALRGVAAQLVAVERARDHAPPAERGALSEGVRRLRGQLDDGLDGYGSLVAAAGRVLAASSPVGPGEELTEATDHLAGLAVALRELQC